MRRLIACLMVPFLFALAGCGTPGPAKRPVPIAGGKVVDIPYGPMGPLPAQANGFQVRQAGFVPGKQEREVVYQFVVTAPPNTSLKSILVDDISEDAGYTLIDDPHPWLTDDTWHAETKPIAASDPRLAWILQVTPSVRVYRFTIFDATDRRTLLYQVSLYPEMFKMAIRHTWGEKY